ncbi:hypothetical protein ACOMHN_036126 [Nucella lapillus]
MSALRASRALWIPLLCLCHLVSAEADPGTCYTTPCSAQSDHRETQARATQHHAQHSLITGRPRHVLHNTMLSTV